MAAPPRPASAAVDGTNELVTRPRIDLATRHLLDERAAARASAFETTADAPQLEQEVRNLEVAAAAADAGFFGGVIGALFGFIFG